MLLNIQSAGSKLKKWLSQIPPAGDWDNLKGGIQIPQPSKLLQFCRV